MIAHEIDVALFSHVQDTTPWSQHWSWTEMVENLTRHKTRANKGGMLWSPTLYKPETTRKAENVIHLTALVLDLDGTDLPLTSEALAEMMLQWEPWTYILHTTHSSTPDNLKVRVVFPLAEPVPVERWAAVWERGLRFLGQGQGDSACKDPCRIYFLPTCPPDTLPFAHVNLAALLSETDLPPLPPPAPPVLKTVAVPSLPTSPERVPWSVLIDHARARLPKGRHPATLWLASQARDNDYTIAETEAALFGPWGRGLPATNSKGDPEPFEDAEITRIIKYAYTQKKRDPWRKKAGAWEVPPELTDADAPPEKIPGMLNYADTYGLPPDPQEGTLAAVAGQPTQKKKTQATSQLYDELIQPKLYWASDLQHKEIPPLEWIIEDMMPEGLTFVSGNPKSGKSFLLAGIAGPVAAGGYAFGKIKVKPGRVLYLALEDGERRMQSRLGALFSQEEMSLSSWPHDMGIIHDWPRQAQGIPLLEEYLRRFPDTRFIIIDTWNAFRAARRVGGDVVMEDYLPLEQLRGLCAERTLGIAVAAHDALNKKGDWINATQGSAGMGGSVSTMWHVVNTRGENEIKLQVAGWDVKEGEYQFKRLETGHFTLLGDAEQIQRTKERQALVDLLKENGPTHYKEAATLLGRKAQTVYVLAQRMAGEKVPPLLLEKGMLSLPPTSLGL